MRIPRTCQTGALSPIDLAVKFRSNFKFVRRTATSTATTHKRARDAVPVTGKFSEIYGVDEWTNVTPSMESLTHRRLLQNPAHPLSTLKQIIFSKFPESEYTRAEFPVSQVSVYENFDSLHFPKDHPGRSKTDTYYLNKNYVLRTHTSAHQVECFRDILTPGFLVAADVYRRDAIDRSHYPVFHQMEGGRWWSPKETDSVDEFVAKINEDAAKIPRPEITIVDETLPYHKGNPIQEGQSPEVCVAVTNHLKRTLEMVVSGIFKNVTDENAETVGQPLQIRWIDATFPFTSPSWEMEVFWNGDWLEIFGCGVTRQGIFESAGFPDRVGWAFGLGLERLAMVLFGVPDIRLFWSQDPRFIEQFSPGVVSRFKSISKYPGTYRDVAFWVNDNEAIEKFSDNDLMDIVRDIAGDLVEDVQQIDKFTHPKTGRTSLCYRIQFQSMERTLLSEEVNRLHESIREELKNTFDVELR